MNWVREHLQGGVASPSPRLIASKSRTSGTSPGGVSSPSPRLMASKTRTSIPAKRHRDDNDSTSTQTSADSVDNCYIADSATMSKPLPPNSQSQDQRLQDRARLELPQILEEAPPDALSVATVPNDQADSQAGLLRSELDQLTETLISLSEVIPHPLLDAFRDPVPQEHDCGVYSSWQPQETCSVRGDSISSTQSRFTGNSDTLETSKRRRKQSVWDTQQGSSISPFSIDQAMVDKSTNDAISTSLLQIYHDVLEHNLSCWLTEVTCPYKSQTWNSDLLNIENALAEWGPYWSNRIYRRTIKLDQVAQSTNMIQLTRSEDQAALRSLQRAIMAFAAQWVQGSCRQRERYSTPNEALENVSNDFAAELAGEFDRTIRRDFWKQAQRALEDVAHLDSYRVVMAEIVFGFTQKPWESDDYSIDIGVQDIAPDDNGTRIRQALILSQVSNVMSTEGPPIYTERAVRRVHTLKFRYDSWVMGLAGPSNKHPGTKEADILQGLTIEDRATTGLLYWVAVMCDTLSSSIHQRPIVLSDEDCQHSMAQDNRSWNTSTALEDPQASRRWNINVFIKDDLAEPCQRVHWPCSYDTAAEAIAKSAPVKILLFRHVSYLQNSLRKGGRGEAIEDIIRNITSLYHYWDMTHGAFFRELVRHYPAVPRRIKGWFVCISAHWHVAAMMLADLIEFVDTNNLGVNTASRNRIDSKMVVRVQQASAQELADLARVATTRSEEGNLVLPSTPNFHHTLHEGTVLTEPWTMILIKGFTRASTMFLGQADDLLFQSQAALGHSTEDVNGSLDRAGECVKGLWVLGKKSDIARKVAEILSLALDRLRKHVAVSDRST